MKKAALMVIMILFLFAGCNTETITEQPGNYQYSVGEPVKIIDIESREILSELTIVGVRILRDEPFTIREHVSYDESGAIYEDVPYQSIVQIYYTWHTLVPGAKSISSANFSVSDSANKRGVSPPADACTPIPLENTDSMIFALKNSSAFITVQFRYGLFDINPTAKFQLDTGMALPSEIPEESSSSIDVPTPESESSTEPAVEVSPAPSAAASQGGRGIFPVFLLIIGLLLFVIVILSVALIVSVRRR